MILDIIFLAVIAVWVVSFWIISDRNAKIEEERNKQLNMLWGAIAMLGVNVKALAEGEEKV